MFNKLITHSFTLAGRVIYSVKITDYLNLSNKIIYKSNDYHTAIVPFKKKCYLGLKYQQKK